MREVPEHRVEQVERVTDLVDNLAFVHLCLDQPVVLVDGFGLQKELDCRSRFKGVRLSQPTQRTRGTNLKMCNRTKSTVRVAGSSQELARTVRSSSQVSNPLFQPPIGSQAQVLVPVIKVKGVCWQLFRQSC